MHKLIAALQKIIIRSDFKSVKTKFLDQTIAEEDIEDSFERFKKLKDQHRIEKEDDKNIDFWGGQPFENFIQFIETLEGTTTKRQIKKAPWKMETPVGADKVAENTEWVVYRVNTFEASQKLGTRNWCISRNEKHWDTETEGRQFYFLLSKTKSYKELNKEEKSGHIEYEDVWHRIALQVDSDDGDNNTWWDADDKYHNKPKVENIPKFELDSPSSSFTCKSDFGTQKLNSTTLQDAIDEARKILLTWYTSERDYYSRLPDETELVDYTIYMAGTKKHTGTVEIEGKFSLLRDTLADEDILGSDPKKRHIAVFRKEDEHGGQWYFLKGNGKDDPIYEIDENDAICFLLQWNSGKEGDLEAEQEWFHENNILYKYKDDYYLYDEDDYSLYERTCEKGHTVRSMVTLLSYAQAFSYLYNWDEFDEVYKNPESPENDVLLLLDNFYYHCYLNDQGELSEIIDEYKPDEAADIKTKWTKVK